MWQTINTPLYSHKQEQDLDLYRTFCKVLLTSQKQRDRDFMKKLYDVVVLRSLATVMVVAFHAYGLMYWDNFPDMTERYKDLYYAINQYVLNFRMPLFVFISGFLFSFLEQEKNKYPTFVALFKNKFKRLIIPYFVFTAIYMLTTGMEFSFKILISGWLAHLWFIPTLFWCFMFTRLSCFLPYSHTRYFKAALLAISFILLFINLPKLGILGIQFFQEWFFWFYFGYVISPYRNQLYDYLNKRKFWLLIFIATYSLELLYTTRFVECEEERGGYVNFAHVAIVLFIWYFTNRAIRSSNKAWYKSAVFKELNKTSYGIYVLHYWLQTLLLSSSIKELLQLNTFATNHVFLFPFLFFLTTLALSYIGTKVLLKTEVGRFLIG